MFTRKLVTPELVEEAHKLFKEIFPKETLYEDGTLESCFSMSCKTKEERGRNVWHYWLYSLSTPENPMGSFISMSGIYTEKEDSDSAWLGWTGVIQKYRHERFGTRMINHFLEEARELGFKYARLYTNEDNLIARAFYEFNGFKGEPYKGYTPDYIGGPVWVYSKSLNKEDPCPAWNDRPLEF